MENGLTSINKFATARNLLVVEEENGERREIRLWFSVDQYKVI
jgi:hypothetical protein